MNYLKPVLVAAILASILAACDSKQENMREQRLENKADIIEQKADAVRDRGEETADRIEKQDRVNSDVSDRAAEAARESSERRADQLEEQADRVREQK